MVELRNSKKTLQLRTGAKIPAMGFGTWQASSEEAYNAVSTALKSGYRHIDTAAVYRNEEAVGRAIRDSGIPREEIFLTTKLWNTQHRNPAQGLEDSLKRLGLDYVDLYLMHWPAPLKRREREDPSGSQDPVPEDPKEWDFLKTWELMQRLTETGKTRAVGVSNFSIKNLKRLLEDERTVVKPAANQVEIHPYLPQHELVEFCKSHDIVVEAYSPLGSSSAQVLRDAAVVEVAEKNGVTPAQAVLGYLLKRDMVVLPKSVKEERIASNLQVFDISDEDAAEIDNLHKVRGVKRFVDPDFGVPLFD